MKKKTKRNLISGMAVTAFVLQIAELGLKAWKNSKNHKKGIEIHPAKNGIVAEHSVVV